MYFRLPLISSLPLARISAPSRLTLLSARELCAATS
jgi:hypothetical protein